MSEKELVDLSAVEYSKFLMLLDRFVTLLDHYLGNMLEQI